VADWVWWVLAVLAALSVTLVVGGCILYVRNRYLDQIVRIFEEKPLFIIPRGKAPAGVDEIAFPTDNGLTLRGCYLPGRGPRRGVILFGLEFGSNRWASLQYCDALLKRGYDVFAYEPRNQGASDVDPTYAPMQWVTDHDFADLKAAVAYLKSRPDIPTGIGTFGVSKGGGLALALAAEEPFVKCVVTDGAYGTRTTVVPFMRRWMPIYLKRMPTWLRRHSPHAVYLLFCDAAIRRSAHRRRVHFRTLDRALPKVRVPVQMIHGGGDTYITPAMAEALYLQLPEGNKHLWVVPKAKHNQAVVVAGEEYGRRVVAFFDEHLAPHSDAPSGDETPVLLPLPAEPAHGRAARVPV
jgi:pimeloyl-ACP methyl ester carboxylesterase